LSESIYLGVRGFVERGSRVSQGEFNPHCVRMRATEHAPRGPFRVLESRHGLAEIIERGGGVLVERLPISPPHFERDFTTIPMNAARHGYRLAQHGLGFFEAP
jgi:hypothetical protein